MKKTTLLLLFCGLLAARADFVYQSGSSFMTTADLDGDGRSDLVLVDGSNASVRVGYQLSAGNITWSAPRPLGMNQVTGISCGNLLNVGHDVLVATEPMLNRYNIFHLTTASQPPVPTAIYTWGAGSKSVVAMDIGGAGNTATDDLFTVATMNGASDPNYAFWLRSDGNTLTDLDDSPLGAEWGRLNEVEYATGVHALAALDDTGFFHLITLTNGTMDWIDGVSLGLSNTASYVSFIPAGDSYAQFLAWDAGSHFLTAFAIEEATPGTFSLTLPTTYDMGSPITSIQLIEESGATRLAIVFGSAQGAGLYTYDGTGAPVLFQSLEPPLNEKFAGFLSLGNNLMIALSSASGHLSGAVTADRMAYSGSQFSSTGSQNLPASGNNFGIANVMTFEGEPFVDSPPRRLQLLRAGDWSSESKITGGTVSATVETDAGSVVGLSNPQSVSLGTANAAAVYTLDNQLHPAISTYSFDAARGDELVNIIINPSSGEYGTSIEVSFSSTPSEPVFYRTDPSEDWTIFSSPIPLFKDTTVQYLAVVGSALSIMREATFTFSEPPSDLDSDGDGIPDYVELANGLDPLESGLDGDGDGFSDLDELLAGSDPTNNTSFPVARLEQGSVYDLNLRPRPYDGVANTIRLSAIQAQLRIFSASGGLRSYEKTKVMPIFGVNTVGAGFGGLSHSAELPFVTALTDARFDVYGISAGNQRGVELAGIYLQPEAAAVSVPYVYAGGSLASESANWITSAQAAYSNQVRSVEEDNFDEKDTLAGLLIERKLADLIYARGVASTNWISLFKGRTPDRTMTGFRSADLQGLESIGSGGEAAYHLPDLIDFIQGQVAGLPELTELTRDLYDICSEKGLNPDLAGQYPLPIDVLREFLFSGVLHSNYLAQALISSADAATAYTEATQLLAQVSSRPLANFTLEVRADSFDAVCPVLYSGSAAKSLYDAKGNPFKFPTSFTLQPGALVSVDAFTDPSWSLCPGTDPLEVVSVALTAVPTASGDDADGNLIPDDYEEMFLVGSGGAATSDLDGDGFSDLQEYLDGTDPNSAGSYGSTPVDFSAPLIDLYADNLAIDWPAAYADAFRFIVEYTEDLPGTPFVTEQELPEGTLDVTLDQSADQRFYRVKMLLR